MHFESWTSSPTHLLCLSSNEESNETSEGNGTERDGGSGGSTGVGRWGWDGLCLILASTVWAAWWSGISWRNWLIRLWWVLIGLWWISWLGDDSLIGLWAVGGGDGGGVAVGLLFFAS